MKRYECIDPETGEVSFFYVGKTSDIKTLYKAIHRASNKGNTSYWLYYEDEPEFSLWKAVYALCIESDNSIHILNSDTMLSMIVEGVVKEI